jgi:hypothetical protein
LFGLLRFTVSRSPPQLADKADRAGRAGAAMTADATPADYDPLYLQGIVHFNACDYYESHEIWEELWTEYRGPSRRFYQALIQAAVALYHFGNGNIRGARKLHGSVHGYLEPYAPRHLGLDVTGFLAAFDACLAEVARSTEEFPRIELNPDLLPEIHLDPPPKPAA